MAYDAVNQEIVLYGGFEQDGTQKYDTWTWDGTDWQQRFPAVWPTWNTPVGLTWDPVNQQAVLYGGEQWVWIWKNHQWQQLSPPSSPDWRRGSAVSWDPTNQRVIVFGGNVVLNDTWLWSFPPNQWVHMTPPDPVPPGRYVHRLEADPSSGLTLLFGGHNYNNPVATQFFNDTWLWTGAAWIQQTPANKPEGRWKTMTAADLARNKVVLFGGEGQLPPSGGPNVVFSDTWVWSSPDQTPPAIVPTVNGQAGANGWYIGTVTVSWSVTDPQSGIVSSSGCGTTSLATDTTGVTLTCSATNGAGLSSSVPVTIKIDATPPSVRCTADPNTLWPPNGKPVKVTVTGGVADATSGIDPSGASFAVTDEYGQVQPSGSVSVGAGGGYSFGVLLTAARNGSDRDGRTYTIGISEQDMAGNTGSCSAVVTVPLMAIQ